MLDLTPLYEAAERQAPREMCGLILENNEFVEMENISKNPKGFEMDAKTFALFQFKSKIKYVCHSHYEEDSKPSEHDKHNCTAIGIPYLIVSYPDKEYTILQP